MKRRSNRTDGRVMGVLRWAVISALNVLCVFGGSATAVRFYDPDPQHLWNRLDDILFSRQGSDGKVFPNDSVDLRYWYRTEHLLSGNSHQGAIAVLDRFVREQGQKLIRDPLKRAILQQDLWQLFDWSAGPARNKPAREAAELQVRLAKIIRTLALNPSEIAALPDNYAAAETKAALPRLPRGLFGGGDWITIANGSQDPAALTHVRDTDGRSVFLVMFRHPAGRQAATNYLRSLKKFRPMFVEHTDSASLESYGELNPDLPQFPPGSQWALVRRLCVIDTEGQIQPTPLIQSIQLRTYVNIEARAQRTLAGAELVGAGQQFSEFDFTRAPGAPLVPVRETDRAFIQFHSNGFDPFENPSAPPAVPPERLKTCAQCHTSGPGIFSVHTFSRSFSFPATFDTVRIEPTTPEYETLLVRQWKMSQFTWGLLRGLWLNEN